MSPLFQRLCPLLDSDALLALHSFRTPGVPSAEIGPGNNRGGPQPLRRHCHPRRNERRGTPSSVPIAAQSTAEHRMQAIDTEGLDCLYRQHLPQPHGGRHLPARAHGCWKGDRGVIRWCSRADWASHCVRRRRRASTSRDRLVCPSGAADQRRPAANGGSRVGHGQ